MLKTAWLWNYVYPVLDPRIACACTVLRTGLITRTRPMLGLNPWSTWYGPNGRISALLARMLLIRGFTTLGSTLGVRIEIPQMLCRIFLDQAQAVNGQINWQACICLCV
jgi:hypothetical protein